MFRTIHLTLLIVVMLGLAACDREIEPTPTLAPTPVAEVEVVDTPTSPPPTASPTATAVPPSPSPTPEPTNTPEPSPTPTELPPTLTPTPTATPEPEIEALRAGEIYTGTLAAGSFQAIAYNGVRFQPVLFFLEVDSTLDASLAVYNLAAADFTTPDAHPPVTQANLGGAGAPEIVVFSPNETGEYTLVVTAVAAAGEFRLHAFDAHTEADNVELLTGVSLAAGEPAVYTLISNGARPILILADPLDQSDLLIRVTGPDGALITEADFAGSGSAEAVFVLSLATTTYTVTIVEVNNAPVRFNVALIALQ